MNKILDDKLHEIKKELNEIPEVSSFLKIKQEIEKSNELNSLKLEIKKEQGLLLKIKDKDSLECQNINNKIKNLMDEYKSNPLIQMYDIYFEEVSSLINNIKDILEF